MDKLCFSTLVLLNGLDSPVLQNFLQLTESSEMQKILTYLNSSEFKRLQKAWDSMQELQARFTNHDFINTEFGENVSSTVDKSSILLESFENAVSTSSPYITGEGENYIKTALPTECLKQKLTLSDILTLIGILVAFYGIILSSRPSEQLERIIMQNDTIIEQQAEIIELSKDDRALSNTLNYLTDTIDLLTDEAELLRERLEDLNNSTDAISQANAGNGKQQNTDAED